ncbi:Protein of uncharacterised function (DUF3052) [Nocardia otitidiscaviarum]|uniref:Protein of uncharacterized function (DUF3052) n=1 Tax=Nocardia otitidiscaviarum TaxID=1823 RepID=A0A379JGH0_9NOCA|nr:Protein of uncharacterised function (DUF3052) [Nocardia otitidiscaviarum]
MFACNYLLSGLEEDTTVVAAADAQNYAQKLGISHGMVVQELGWDEDTDDTLRNSIEETIGSELLDEDTDEVVEVVLLWWRDGDGDLVDELLNVITPLADDGIVWVLTPKTGQPGHVDPSEIAESAPSAGLNSTTPVSLGSWTGTKLTQPKTPSKQR